jgi:hypothetical protein
VYISLPDTSATCASWTGLAPLPTGWSYVCSTPANFRRTDGTGWIPVNFDASAGGSPFAVLPIDPVNNVSHYYTYVTGGSWNLTALMESSHESTLRPAVNDNGAMPGVLEIGTNSRLGPFTRDRGLVGFWRFEEGTGTTTADSSGNANTGTLFHGPTWQPPANCKQGRCLSFDGVDDFGEAPDSPSLSPRSAITIAAWVRMAALSGGFTPITHKHGEARAWWFGFHPNSSTVIHWSNEGGVFPHSVDGHIPSVLGTWRHLVVTYENGVGRRIYSDGGLVASDTATGLIPDTTGPMLIAHGWDFWHGLIDEIRIYNRALSAAEIQAIYAATK